MNDVTILYSGVVCFALMLLGVGLTVYEFRKNFRRHPPREQQLKNPSHDG